ncbi:hypothetical protein WR25_22833 isoform A [Diploscapter pachys]|uniref:Uncharacterized protein n=1 Tax=Diploscapter pachys TaxID=2018661 RepID=A0A2A2LGR2_9BILA|nr:hypothetical protein WR25_22833 isoform A [Diploscapter pachys]
MSIAQWKNKFDFQRLHRFLRSLLYAEDVDYSQFESKLDGTDIATFRENDKAFRLFGTNVHVKAGAYIACIIGLIVTMVYVVVYSFFHYRGMGRNPFIDHLELVDLIFAILLGIPCHFMLFYGLRAGKSIWFSPFLIFYTTNFVLNIVFTILTLSAFGLDIHRKIFGNVRFDLGWTLFQILFTSSQGLAIYVVIKARRYVNAKDFWRQKSQERNSQSIVADGVVID